jgi:hypothetical protein
VNVGKVDCRESIVEVARSIFQDRSVNGNEGEMNKLSCEMS